MRVAPRPTAPDAGSSSPNAEFLLQSRDVAWAPSTENEIKRRYERIRGARLTAAECRHDRCRMELVGSRGDVARAIVDLEGDRGLHGFAANVVLTAPEQQANGSVVLQAFAVFER